MASRPAIALPTTVVDPGEHRGVAVVEQFEAGGLGALDEPDERGRVEALQHLARCRRRGVDAADGAVEPAPDHLVEEGALPVHAERVSVAESVARKRVAGDQRAAAAGRRERRTWRRGSREPDANGCKPAAPGAAQVRGCVHSASRPRRNRG